MLGFVVSRLGEVRDLVASNPGRRELVDGNVVHVGDVVFRRQRTDSLGDLLPELGTCLNERLGD